MDDTITIFKPSVSKEKFIAKLQPKVSQDMTLKTKKATLDKQINDALKNAGEDEEQKMENGRPDNLNIIMGTKKVKEMISPIFLKVCSLSNDIKGKYSYFKIVRAKDIDGNHIPITLYKNSRLMVTKVGDVFKFTGLQVGNYKNEKEPFNRLESSFSTKIMIAPVTMQNTFSNIVLGDGILTGEIVSFNQVYIYPACTMCYLSLIHI